LVYVDYTLKDPSGTVIETTNSTVAKEAGIFNVGTQYVPLSFIVGSGMMIPGFDQAVVGMKINDTKNVTLTPAQAYGDYNQSLVVTVPLKKYNASDFTQYVGQMITFNGENAKLIGIDAANNTVTLDYNHPMAGKTLVFDITLRAINPSPLPT
ncbi:MAG TPA: peptidylprolyl isomerase, partial [Methanocella sp.]|uniref:FKBP-type peptidyl-prolyl cis-trans isomerase n=1 Tax=Methanocella sp. TaxID=2052833 RepID=UPI002BB11D31